MFKYEMITKEKEGDAPYIYLNIGTSNGKINGKLVKALGKVEAIMGIRVTNENGEYVDYWYGYKRDIEEAVKCYGLPRYKALIISEHGFDEMVLLKDGNFQICDSHNLAISEINLARTCMKQSYNSKTRKR